MKKQTLGILRFYQDENNPSTYSTFKLREGEHLIGSSPSCEVNLPYLGIAPIHCKITLSSEHEYSIEDLGSTSGTTRLWGDQQTRQNLKPKKEYELVSKRPFYIANKYKCVFEESFPKNSNDEEDEDLNKDQDYNLQGGVGYLEDQPTLLLDDAFPENEYIKIEIEEEEKKEPNPVIKTTTEKVENTRKNFQKQSKVRKEESVPEPESKPKISEKKHDKEKKDESRIRLQDKKVDKEKRDEPKAKLQEKKVDKEKKDVKDLKIKANFREKDINNSEELSNLIQKKNSRPEKSEKKNEIVSSPLIRKASIIKDSAPSTNKTAKPEKPNEVIHYVVNGNVYTTRQKNDSENSLDNVRNINKANENEGIGTRKKTSLSKQEIVEEKPTPKKRGRPPKNKDSDQRLSMSQPTDKVEKPSKKDSVAKNKRAADTNSLSQYEKTSKDNKKIKTDKSILVDEPKEHKRSVEKGSLDKDLVTQINKRGRKPSGKNSVESEKRSLSKSRSERSEESPSTRGIPKRNACQVMFSGILPRDLKIVDEKRKLTYLGAKIVEEREKHFTVLVMDKFKRTIKFLLAMVKGIDVVSYDWVVDSINEGRLLPTEDYIYIEKGAETRHKFKLSHCLDKAKSRTEGILHDFRVYLPPNLKPSTAEIKLLVEAMEGTILKAKPSHFEDDILIILDESDKKSANHFVGISFTPYTTEFIFSTILQQKVDLNSNQV